MGMEKGLLKATWGYNGNLEPLYEVENLDDRILVTFDLPRVKKEDVEVHTTRNTLEVTARMSNAVCWERWGVVQKKIAFQAFKKQIRLPEPIEPEQAEATLKNGVLRIAMPKIRQKVSIKLV